MMKLIDILELYSQEMPNLEHTNWDDIRPDNDVRKITLCFMCEQETWVTTYPEHPILIPFYECEVESIDVVEENTLRVWLSYEKYMPILLKKEMRYANK